MVTAKIFDLLSGEFLTQFQQPATIGYNQERISISGEVWVPGDSTTPEPHSHKFNLIFQLGNEDIVSLQNCDNDVCYPATLLD